MLGMVAAIGACVGSFLNVVAYRLPRACMSIVKPRSRCPRCASMIAWYDNLPVLSWLMLRGRCRTCDTRISARYPLVELGVTALFAVVAWRVLPLEALRRPAEHGAEWLHFCVAALITSSLIALSLIDLDYLILPDQITKTGIVIGPLLAFLDPAIQPTLVIKAWTVFGLLDRPLETAIGLSGVALVHGVLGALVAGGTLWLIGVCGTWAFKKEAMGFGDVKMIAAMGGVLGFWSLLALVVAVMTGAVVGIVVKLAGKGRYIPFGPFLALGMWIVMLWGVPVLAWWLRL